MVPWWHTNLHPAAASLREYAKSGCPVTVGQDWTLEELEAAVEKGPHGSALAPHAIDQIHVEAREKEEQGFANIYNLEELKKPPLTMIQHKFRKYSAILDLSFQLMVAWYLLPLVNDATKKWALQEAMDQIGSVLPQIIEALAMAPGENSDILFSKLDIKDGFWRIVCGDE